MNGSDADGYLDTMDSEFQMLNKSMKAWDIVDRTKAMHALPST